MASERRLSQVATTIPVRNVQALAACSADELTVEALDRYIRPDIDEDAVLEEHSGELPVVDLGRLLNSDSWEEEAAKLRFACEEWGFFQVLNHGVPEEVIVNIKRDIQQFFQLPLEVKNAYAQRPGDLQGYGQAYVVSEDQKLDWADMLCIIAQPSEARDMKLWPAQPLTFRKSLEDYSVELKRIAHSITIVIGRILNVEPELMGDKYVVQALRMNYYPPCMSMPEKIMTNGKFRSIEHRVTINAHQERLSLSAFINPKFVGVVSPVLGSTTEKVLYKTVSVEDYIKHHMSNKLDGKRALDHAKVF
ncbi:Protein SRG1 [Dichanthelium oligosanthes]|uniref:Protein SRG1 n=1 Tax=Dichanthelium oligosanthes TaxID=888268 RepID=A0A1E5UIG2_9POAL|nr:Protein SRG1 [Dichanthelium oligosanthes]